MKPLFMRGERGRRGGDVNWGNRSRRRRGGGLFSLLEVMEFGSNHDIVAIGKA